MSVDKDWDRILDKYESLCESCIQLKLKAEAGEKISKSAFGKLFLKSTSTHLYASLATGFLITAVIPSLPSALSAARLRAIKGAMQ